MKKSQDIVQNVIDSFFDLDVNDKIVHLSIDDSDLLSTAIIDSLKTNGVISEN